QRPGIDARGNLRLPDALHAERALLHHAAFADRDVWILDEAFHIADARVVVEPIEPTDLVWAIVRAEPGSDAAVVDHLVEAVAAVDGRFDRADVLARRLLTLLAEHRLCDGGRVARPQRRIPVDPQPVHL